MGGHSIQSFTTRFVWWECVLFFFSISLCCLDINRPSNFISVAYLHLLWSPPNDPHSLPPSLSSGTVSKILFLSLKAELCLHLHPCLIMYHYDHDHHHCRRRRRRRRHHRRRRRRRCHRHHHHLPPHLPHPISCVSIEFFQS